MTRSTAALPLPTTSLYSTARHTGKTEGCWEGVQECSRWIRAHDWLLLFSSHFKKRVQHSDHFHTHYNVASVSEVIISHDFCPKSYGRLNCRMVGAMQSSKNGKNPNNVHEKVAFKSTSHKFRGVTMTITKCPL